MIVQVNVFTQYARQGTTGPQLICELTEESAPGYAHSIEDAQAWVAAQKLYSGCEPHSLGDGRVEYATEWFPYKPHPLFEDEDKHDIAYTRDWVVIHPVATI